jgi:NAD(P)H-nitrite reductase large subunit
MTNWNDDERDTRDYIKTPIHVNKNAYTNDNKHESIVKIIQDYHKDAYNEIYKDTNYKKGNKLTRPKNTYIYVNSAPQQIINKRESDMAEVEEDQECNNDILDKQIYRKCWYS